MTMEWPMDTTVAQAENLLWIPADEEAIILHSNLNYYKLNASATRIWDLLALPQSSLTLQSLLCLEYKVDLQTCGEDLAHFLARLLQVGLLITAEGSGEPMAPRNTQVQPWQAPQVSLIDF